MARPVALVLMSVLALVGSACSGSDRADDGGRSASTTETVGRTTTTAVPATTTPTTVGDPAGTPEELLAADAETLAAAAATGEFCAAYGAYDLLASRAEGAAPADAVAIFELGFAATTRIGPLVPKDIEDEWSTFVYGAGLIAQVVERAGRLPEGDAELEAALDRIGYWDAGDQVTAWYLQHCG